jgi:hypothetical protein
VKDDGDWVSYAKTIVEFIPSDQEAFTIRPAAPGTTGEWPTGFRAPIYVVTAWNPGKERPGEVVNRDRQNTLQTELRSRGLDLCPTIGRDPDSPHFEEGVAVSGISEDEAIELGAHYGQDAIFSWTPEALTILSCVDTRRHESGWTIYFRRTPTVRS